MFTRYWQGNYGVWQSIAISTLLPFAIVFPFFLIFGVRDITGPLFAFGVYLNVGLWRSAAHRALANNGSILSFLVQASIVIGYIWSVVEVIG